MSKSYEDITADEYVSHFEPYAKAYKEALDRLLSVVSEVSVKRVQEVLIEFLHLPFWKDRWFLYEVWTLCRVLNIALQKWPVRLSGLELRTEGITVWNLAGADARSPAALIGDSGSVERGLDTAEDRPSQDRKGLGARSSNYSCG